jgi:D-lactate dehydrogenase
MKNAQSTVSQVKLRMGVMTSILFLETDTDDRSTILARFPSADIRSEALSGDALVKACAGKQIVSCFIYSMFTVEVIKQLPELKLICTRSVGFNHIDLDACAEKGITVCNVPDYGSHVIAEHAFALILSVLRHIGDASSKVSTGNFDYHGLKGMALHGKTMGIVGTGKIGRNTAAIAHGFGMRILAVDQCRVLDLESRYGVRYVGLDELLAASDIITLHVPALPETIHMINAQTIAAMKDGVIVVNTARGELVDSSALLQGLKSGKIAYALLDVLEHEKDFRWNEELIKHPHVVVTPHIAFYADDSVKQMFQDGFASIDQWSRGETPLHTIQKPAAVVCDLPGIRKM